MINLHSRAAKYTQLDRQSLTVTMHNRQCLVQQHDSHETHMFRIKVCGITNPEDAVDAVDAGADAIGVNFYAGSKRSVGIVDARRIVAATVERCMRVGVFVNQTPEELNAIANGVGLDAVQLHGDQPPSYLLDIEQRYPVVRVYRVGDRGFIQLKTDLMMCARFGREPAAVLIDALAASGYGGTGERIEWSTLADRIELVNFDRAEPIRLILAGGLTPENVAEAIMLVQPFGVDVASGVESSPGHKDPAKVRAFVAEARRGFAEIGRD